VSELLPAGMVTLLLADAEDSTRLWEAQPEQMTAAIARLKRALSEAILEHDGVLPLDQGEGDSFVVAFARASSAVAWGGGGSPCAPPTTGPDPATYRCAHRRGAAA
jgi:class 3 adenylate cyclase